MSEHAFRNRSRRAAGPVIALSLAGLALLAAACGSTGRVPGVTAAVAREIVTLDQIHELLAKGKLEAALEKTESYAADAPDKVDRRLVLASVRASAGDLDGARAATEEAKALAPQSAEPWFFAAELASWSGDQAGRKAALDKALALDPAHADVLAAYGDLHWEEGAYAKAEDSYRRAFAADATNLGALLGMGRAAYRKDDFKASASFLDRAVAAHPSSSLARSDRARARYELGRYLEALDDLDAAVELDPDSAWHRVERGQLLLDFGRSDEALADFSRAIELDPSDFLPYVYRAGIHEEAGRDGEALADYKKLLALEPDYWYANESIGTVAFRSGDWKTAREGFEAAFRMSPVQYEYAIMAAVSLARGGDAEGARALAEKVMPSVDREKFPAEWLALRLFYDRSGSTSEIELRIGAETRLDMKAALLLWLGEYWIAKGRPELGATYVGLSLELDRQGTIWHRLAEAEAKRPGSAKP
ncbi:MAG: tetratricopeptide repeat protein [Spirochaetales bacterium]|nr:tetratricopeptide repeat protein [Spirochaetales bacterium]